jgi:hypothetical protein
MTIRITISDRAQIRVRGSNVNDVGASEAFDFRLTVKRLDDDTLKSTMVDLAANHGRINDFLADVVLGWHGVLDDQGDEVPFSAGALVQLLRHTGLPLLILKAYNNEVQAKEKN